MAKKTLLFSDLTGAEIVEGALAHVRITLSSKPYSTFTLDASEEEVAELVAKTTERKKRGRPAQTT